MSDQSAQSPETTAQDPSANAFLTLDFADAALPDASTWEHLIVSLSALKQEQIMTDVGLSHSQESPFKTWSVLGQCLSTALLSESDSLYVQSTTQLFRKDFLLFTKKVNEHGDGTAGILEVNFVKRLGTARWEGQWQQARPQMVHFVKETLAEFLKNDEKSETKVDVTDGVPGTKKLDGQGDA